MRNQTIDIAKGIGILTVVICHNWILYHDRGEFSRVIFSFHMPLFFFISGIFFKPNLTFKETVISKANSILKPYAVITLFLILFDYINSIASGQPLNLVNVFIRGLYASIGTLSVDEYSSALGWVPLWFLSHLFAVYISAWLLHFIVLKRVSNSYVILCILMAFYFIGISTLDLFWSSHFNPLGINTYLFGDHQRTIGLPLSMDLLLVTTPIFLAGHYLSKYMLDFRFNAVLFTVSLLTFIGLHFQYDLTMALHDRQYDDYLVTTVQMITGIYCVFGFSSCLSKFSVLNKTLAYLGSASLFILIFHYSIQHRLTGIFQYKFPEYNYLIAYCAFVFSVFYSVFLFELVSRFRITRKIFFDSRKK